MRGASFGLRQSLDTIGGFAGPALAIVAMGLLANDIRAVFWIAVIPALGSVAILVAFVHEPDRRAEAGAAPVPLRLADVRTLDRALIRACPQNLGLPTNRARLSAMA